MTRQLTAVVVTGFLTIMLFGAAWAFTEYKAIRNPTTKGTAEAAYVRDPAHRCKVVIDDPDARRWDYAEHRVHLSPGYKRYECAEGIAVGIWNNEAQP